MPSTRTLNATLVAVILLATGCAQEPKSPIDRAVENTKDALDLRDNEKLKDAGEDARDAVMEAKEGVKDALDGKK